MIFFASLDAITDLFSCRYEMINVYGFIIKMSLLQLYDILKKKKEGQSKLLYFFLKKNNNKCKLERYEEQRKNYYCWLVYRMVYTVHNSIMRIGEHTWNFFMGSSMRRSNCRAQLIFPATGGAFRTIRGFCLFLEKKVQKQEWEVRTVSKRNKIIFCMFLIKLYIYHNE